VEEGPGRYQSLRASRANLSGLTFVGYLGASRAGSNIRADRAGGAGVVQFHGVNYKDDTDAARKWLLDLHNPYQLNNQCSPGAWLGLDLRYVYGAPETFSAWMPEGVIRYNSIGVDR